MQQDILINWSPQETRVAMVEQGAVQELQVERTLERGLVGNVYLGKVARVLPGMQSAFIDIGLDRAAFLHVADLMSSINSRHLDTDAAAAPATSLPIEKQLFEGQAMMVQVLKDPIGTKGARLSAQISIAGRLLVFLPQDNHIGVSQKIPPRQREDLRERLRGLSGELDGGFILRTNGGPIRTTPVTPSNGTDTVSEFVTLATVGPALVGAMTVNERLFASGLMDAFDAAVETGELDEINRVLARVGLRQDKDGMNWSIANDA